MTLDAMLFFQGTPGLLPLYEAVETAILTVCPDTEILVTISRCPRRETKAKRRFTVKAI